MTIEEAAAALHVSPRTIRRLVNRKLLRACRAVRTLLIPREDVESFVDRTCS
jgi:excisionase family DNA binding protein